MSLINDMLRDLDRRRLQPPGGHGAFLQGLGLAPARMHSLYTSPAGRHALGVTFVFMAGILAVMLYRQHVPADHSTTIALPLPAATQREVHAGTAQAAAAEQAVTPAAASTAPAAPRAAALDAADALPAPAPDSAPVDDTVTSIEVSPRPLTREQRQARDLQLAATAIGNGDLAGAEAQLQELLEGNAGLHRARLLLAGLYVEQQRNNRAEALLASGLRQYPLHAPYARMYGQLLAEQARDSEAITALKTALPAAADDAGYHALLAGLYQRNGRPVEAIEHYRTAVRLAPDQGAWWTGLGISSEQAGVTGEAVSAYRRALQHALEPAVQRYVQQRLGQLAH